LQQGPRVQRATSGGEPAPGRLWDVIVVGGGPAGLGAALVLGRCCRSVLLCDDGTPRSWASSALHGFPTREGVTPSEFRRRAREELAAFENVVTSDRRVVDAAPYGTGFEIAFAGGGRARTRKLLLATGLMDALPELPGIAPLWGTSVHHCPYCHGWEVRGAPVAVVGDRRRALEMARALTAWTSDIGICSDGAYACGARERRRLARNGIALYEQRIDRLRGRDGRLEAVEFADGSELRCEALFFDMPAQPQSDLVERLGCKKSRDGTLRRGRYEATSVPGVYAAGNILKDVQLAIVAAAEGVRAAFGINRALTREDFERRASGTRRVEHPPLEERASLQL
jgi:thioredoxin reductase